MGRQPWWGGGGHMDGVCVEVGYGLLDSPASGRLAANPLQYSRCVLGIAGRELDQ